MSDPNLPPEQWRPLFDAAGIEFGYRPLANRAAMNHTRVRRVLRGEGTTEDAIRQVADTLNVSPAKVHELRGEPAVEIHPFTLPDDAGRLTERERDVIRAMVRALIEAKDQHAVSVSDSSASSGASGEAQQGKKITTSERAALDDVEAAAAEVAPRLGSSAEEDCKRQ